ncbi:CocE/NonD family hydrolase [Streptomyces sp. NPDC006235]|uniref:CocE/NonD family hydrolase n=1 Tax=Streptomyces sp. NPDC006235 TaxID=3156736 RepID=UPI0033BAEF44
MAAGRRLHADPQGRPLHRSGTARRAGRPVERGGLTPGTTDPRTTHEESDGYDTVRWAAALPGSSGPVGMIGGSYSGNTQWRAALSKPPELPELGYAPPSSVRR